MATVKKRLFIAIDISDEAREKIGAYIDCLRSHLERRAATWVRPENLHLTLYFVGDCDDDELRRLTQLVSQSAETQISFNITIAGSGVFPNAKRPRVLWFGIRDDGRHLASIKTCIENHYVSADLARKPSDFKPHLTIARIKDARAARKIMTKHLASNFEPVGFGVSEIVIYESTLTRDGSVYSVLSKHPLRGDPD